MFRQTRGDQAGDSRLQLHQGQEAALLREGLGIFWGLPEQTRINGQRCHSPQGRTVLELPQWNTLHSEVILMQKQGTGYLKMGKEDPLPAASLRSLTILLLTGTGEKY